jgi:hypothetical protein
MKPSFFAVLPAAVALSFFSQGLALPVLVKGTSLKALSGSMRPRLVAFKSVAGKWSRVSIQTDEVEDDAFLVLRKPQTVMPLREKVNHPGDKDPFMGEFSQVHRVVLDSSDFAPCDAKCSSSASAGLSEVCGAGGGMAYSLFKVSLKNGDGVVFLGECQRTVAPLPETAISFDGTSTISAPDYRVVIGKTSPFLIEMLKDGKGNATYLKGGELHAKLKTKLFVNVNVDNGDLAASITSVSRSTLATSLELAVQEKVLGFSTGKQVCCDITYYRDAFYFPVLIAPPEKLGKLRDGSFVALGFQSPLKVISAAHPVQPAASGKKGGSGAAYLLFDEGGKKLGMSLRPTGKSRSYSSRTIGAGDDLKEYGLENANSGLVLDLSDKSGEQRFEAWFFVGENEALLREFAEGGIQTVVTKP